jgi:hypothetical protein
MSDQIPWETIIAVIGAVIGVVIGWSLSQLTDLVKNKRRKTLIKRALINELSIIRKTFSDALKSGENRIRDEQVPFITETYDSVGIELASFLKPDSLAIVQRTYEEIRKLNPEDHHGHLVMGGSLDHIFQFTDFNKLIALIDDSVTRLK